MTIVPQNSIMIITISEITTLIKFLTVQEIAEKWNISNRSWLSLDGARQCIIKAMK